MLNTELHHYTLPGSNDTIILGWYTIGVGTRQRQWQYYFDKQRIVHSEFISRSAFILYRVDIQQVHKQREKLE